MPCRDYQNEDDRLNLSASELNIMIRLACDRCQEIESRGGEIPMWAVEWWENHKRQDEEQSQRTEEARRSSDIRKKAIAKLTQQERDELGV